jgi:putative oxidoreductase
MECASQLHPGRNALQRLFSAFPNRWPGVALVLLRVTAGVIILTQVVLQTSRQNDPKLGFLFLTLLFGTSGVFLLLGFLTPIAGLYASLYSLGVALSWIPMPASVVFDAKIASPEMIAMSIALTLLGPGAYSVDARLFGRREIIIPTKSRSTKS